VADPGEDVAPGPDLDVVLPDEDLRDPPHRHREHRVGVLERAHDHPEEGREHRRGGDDEDDVEDRAADRATTGSGGARAGARLDREARALRFGGDEGHRFTHRALFLWFHRNCTIVTMMQSRNSTTDAAEAYPKLFSSKPLR